MIINRNNYYSLEDLPKEEVKVELKDNPHKCGNCRYLIFKDYGGERGFCHLLRVYRYFWDPCVHKEEMS